MHVNKWEKVGSPTSAEIPFYHPLHGQSMTFNFKIRKVKVAIEEPKIETVQGLKSLSIYSSKESKLTIFKPDPIHGILSRPLSRVTGNTISGEFLNMVYRRFCYAIQRVGSEVEIQKIHELFH